MIKCFLVAPIKLLKILKNFIVSKETYCTSEYSLDCNFENIVKRVELVKNAIEKENLIKTESQERYITKYYNVESLGEVPVTEL